MKTFFLSLAFIIGMVGVSTAQEIETPFGGVHGPFVSRHEHYYRGRDAYSERWREHRHHRHWHPGGGHWEGDED